MTFIELQEFTKHLQYLIFLELKFITNGIQDLQSEFLLLNKIIGATSNFAPCKLGLTSNTLGADIPAC